MDFLRNPFLALQKIAISPSAQPFLSFGYFPLFGSLSFHVWGLKATPEDSLGMDSGEVVSMGSLFGVPTSVVSNNARGLPF